MWIRRWIEPIYRIEISIMIGRLDQLRAHMRRRFPHFDHGVSFRRASMGKAIEIESGLGWWTDYAIWLPTWQGRDEDFQTLAHETLHVTFKALRQKGFRPTDSSEEAYTYYQEYLLRECLRRLRTYGTQDKKSRRRKKRH